MAASAWVFYNIAKQYLLDGTYDIDDDDWKMALFASASDIETVTFSIFNEISDEVATGNGYTTGGKSLPTDEWVVGASATQMRFDATATIWTASGGTIPLIRYALLYNNTIGSSQGDTGLLCYAALTTAEFTLTDTNTLTVTPANPDGIFTLV